MEVVKALLLCALTFASTISDRPTLSLLRYGADGDIEEYQQSFDDFDAMRPIFADDAVIVSSEQMSKVADANLQPLLAPFLGDVQGKLLKMIRAGPITHTLYQATKVKDGTRSFAYGRWQDEAGKIKVSLHLFPLHVTPTPRSCPKQSTKLLNKADKDLVNKASESWETAYTRRDWKTMKNQVYTHNAVIVNAVPKTPKMMMIKDISATQLGQQFPDEKHSRGKIVQVIREGDSTIHEIYLLAYEDGRKLYGYSRLEKKDNSGDWQFAIDIWPLSGSTYTCPGE